MENNLKIEDQLLEFYKDSLTKLLKNQVKEIFNLKNTDSKVLCFEKSIYSEIQKQFIKQRNNIEDEYFFISYSFSSHNNFKINKFLNNCDIENIPKNSVCKNAFFMMTKNIDIQIENLYNDSKLKELSIPLSEFKEEIFKLFKNKFSDKTEKVIINLNILSEDELMLMIKFLTLNNYKSKIKCLNTVDNDNNSLRKVRNVINENFIREVVKKYL